MSIQIIGRIRFLEKAWYFLSSFLETKYDTPSVEDIEAFSNYHNVKYINATQDDFTIAIILEHKGKDYYFLTNKEGMGQFYDPLITFMNKLKEIAE